MSEKDQKIKEVKSKIEQLLLSNDIPEEKKLEILKELLKVIENDRAN